ncbi:coiled-coil domain-containing protein 50 isoform X5 [Carcharodon carcharias]|uniref:coiled-coil domain-containing protein 50 isoform X5 n=1 Tax=Carcharodon carcharias TaxID=13397 RepID=UPI001B7E263F|nr:coiled-coil domain-containing protein 50 isoform X5 [Carcharodon carcharias]
MADFSIDQSSLPAVNTVCREFAVREDHSLAHTLQEQEIEHHLASNVQRNRLVQNDLQMAKKLQEEENKKAQVRLQKQQREMERRDNQMAQVIQDELTLESEKRRRQEEKDEAIARKLQEKEEKLRRKQQEVIGHEPNDVGFEENGGLNPRMDDAVKETMHGISRMSAKDLEWKDAELARKLQEEEIMAIQSSKRAAQMAQDEEIAWLLMEEEKKQPHKKSKDKDSAWRAEEDRRKGSSEGRRHEQEKKHGSSEYIRPKPREGPEQLTGKPEKPGRPPTYREESTPQRPPRPASRSSESSQKGIDSCSTTGEEASCLVSNW